MFPEQTTDLTFADLTVDGNGSIQLSSAGQLQILR